MNCMDNTFAADASEACGSISDSWVGYGGGLGGAAETWSLQILTSNGTGQGDRS